MCILVIGIIASCVPKPTIVIKRYLCVPFVLGYAIAPGVYAIKLYSSLKPAF